MPSILVKLCGRPEQVDCDYAVIEISPKLAQEYLDHMQCAADVKRRTPGLLALSIRSVQPEWFSGLDVEEVLDGGLQERLGELYPVIIDRDSLPELEFHQVDCVTIECREDGVYWRAYVQHTNYAMETGLLDREFLESLRCL